MNEGISFEDYLSENDSLTYSNKGISMLPLLREGKDLFTVLKKGSNRCQVGDVVLYRRPTKEYVLHRVIRVREHDYVILGDNCIQKEYGIQDEDVLGVMIGFVRGGKTHSVSELNYRLYSFLIIHTIPIRVFIKRVILYTKALLKRGVTH